MALGGDEPDENYGPGDVPDTTPTGEEDDDPDSPTNDS